MRPRWRASSSPPRRQWWKRRKKRRPPCLAAAEWAEWAEWIFEEPPQKPVFARRPRIPGPFRFQFVSGWRFRLNTLQLVFSCRLKRAIFPPKQNALISAETGARKRGETTRCLEGSSPRRKGRIVGRPQPERIS